MRFIHAADIHLDSPLRGLGSYEDMPVEILRGATRAAFSRLVDEALALEVDFMVIAGDLYDGDWKDHNTGVYFARQMGRLRNADIPVYVLHGNHDAESVMTSRLALPENVHVFSSRRPQTFRLEAHKVALHGRSFPQAQVTENLVSDYPAPIPGYFNIGVLHTALEGGPATPTMRPAVSRNCMPVAISTGRWDMFMITMCIPVPCPWYSRAICKGAISENRAQKALRW